MRRSNWNGLLEAFLQVLVLSAAGAVLAAPAEVEQAKADWAAGKYDEVYTALRAYRSGPQGRTRLVDFMLGTSGCRSDATERQRQGIGYLRSALTYPPPPSGGLQSRVRGWIAECQEHLISSVLLPPEADAGDATGAESGGSAKMFFWGAPTGTGAGERHDAVLTYLPRPLTPLPAGEVARRLVPVTESVAAAAAAVQRLVPLARVVVVKPFVIASESNHSAPQLIEIGERLARYLGFLEKEYGVLPPTCYIAVYMMPSPQRLGALARDVHHLDINEFTIGYTHPADNAIAGVIPRMLIGTLLHETFHVVVRTNFGDIPQWLDEGVAALYEVSSDCGDRFFGEPNWRGPILKALWQQRPKLEAIVGRPWFAADDPESAAYLHDNTYRADRLAVESATARYFLLYLQERGQLQQVYTAIRDLDPAALAKNQDLGEARRNAVLRALGNRSWTDVQADYEHWFNEISEPAARLPRPQCTAVGKELPQSAPR